jgi:hypothetical protein
LSIPTNWSTGAAGAALEGNKSFVAEWIYREKHEREEV